ncbi:hypothetical protein HMPREF0645_0117 [Hallella bergensis DSM 17361]|uniref:Uncharacterized protein n=1 Tax=Hallella bergensis DSM 17361 TaxID=585502 RepID=D1PT32_9BACT|nr:hypothetical protein HMPREF0645_0117 [Hallella bergensis DSM 17361]
MRDISCENTVFPTFISCAILYMRQYKDKNSNRKIFKSMYIIEY